MTTTSLCALRTSVSRDLFSKTLPSVSVAFLLSGALSAHAQNGVTHVEENAPIRLSPFEVNTDRDDGFAASSSLAGGRLAGELKDTPVAYSVITREFIDALQITDLAEAAAWSPNTVMNVAANGGGLGDDISNSPGSYSVRGSGRGRQQRNFFVYFSPMDSYAVERFDFGRGPNAVLFGNGSLGGVSSTMTKQARFDQSFTRLAQSLGSWNNVRSTIDVNRTVGQRLALRAAAVWADRDGWRMREFEEMRALFLTGTFKVTPTTSVRVEGEYGESARNQTFNNIRDAFSGWDGRTVYQGPLTTLPSNANALGISRRGAGYLVYDPFSGVNAIMNYQNDPITIAGGSNAQVPIAGYVQGSQRPFNTGNAHLLYAINVPDGRFDNAIAGSNFRVPDESFTLASDAPVIRQRFRDVQVTVDHRIGETFFQFAADMNRTDQRTNAVDLRNSSTSIDINRNLPNGAPNPHFLEPYTDAGLRRNRFARDADAFRFAVGRELRTERWGRYTFNLMAGFTETRDHNYGNENLSIAQNPDRRRWGATGTDLAATDMVLIRRYWNEPSRPIPDLPSVRYINPITGVDKTIEPIWALGNDSSAWVSKNTSRYRYAIGAFNAKFLRERLVVLGATRVDSFYSHARQQVHVGDYPAATWDGFTPIYKPNAPEDYATMSYVPKDSAGLATGPAVLADTRPRDSNGNPLPQYAQDRFKADYNPPAIDESQVTYSVGATLHLARWVSPYINYAETFNPPDGLERLDSSLSDSTVAKGIDVGLRFSFLRNRLSVNMLHYQNQEKNNTFGAGIVAPINTLLNANPIGDNDVAGRNKRGMGALPQRAVDLRDRSAKGYEVEIIANLSKRWRLSLNAGFPEVYEENSFQDSKRYLEANDATLRQIAIDAGALIDVNNVASVDLSIPVDQRSPDVNSAVSSYNTIVNQRQAFVDGRRILQKQPNYNVFTDYSVGTGWLKGLRLGGGLQYRGRQVIGNRAGDLMVDPANPSAAIDDPSVDAYTPVYSPASYSNTIMTLSYSRRVGKNRTLEFNLKINNLMDSRGPIYASGTTVLRPLNGDFTSPARETVANFYALTPPRSFLLMTTYKF